MGILSKKVLTLNQVDCLNSCYTIECSQNQSMSSTEPKAYLHALEHKWRDLILVLIKTWPVQNMDAGWPIGIWNACPRIEQAMQCSHSCRQSPLFQGPAAELVGTPRWPPWVWQCWNREPQGSEVWRHLLWWRETCGDVTHTHITCTQNGYAPECDLNYR